MESVVPKAFVIAILTCYNSQKHRRNTVLDTCMPKKSTALPMKFFSPKYE